MMLALEPVRLGLFRRHLRVHCIAVRVVVGQRRMDLGQSEMRYLGGVSSGVSPSLYQPAMRRIETPVPEIRGRQRLSSGTCTTSDFGAGAPSRTYRFTPTRSLMGIANGTRYLLVSRLALNEPLGVNRIVPPDTAMLPTRG